MARTPVPHTSAPPGSGPPSQPRDGCAGYDSPVRRFALVLVSSGALAAGVRPASCDTLGDLQARFAKEQDFTTRLATLNEIAGVGTLEALRFIERVEKEDKSASLRANAVHSIAKVAVPQATDALLRIYKDGDVSRRSVVLAAWTFHRKENLPAAIVTESLASKDPSARTSLLDYLSRRDDPRLVPAARRFEQDFPSSASSILPYLVEHPSVESAALVLRIYDDENPYHRDTVPKLFVGGSPKVRAVLLDTIAAGRDPLLLKAAQIASRGKLVEAEAGLVAAARGAKSDERRASYLDLLGRMGLATDAGRALALEWLGSDVDVLIAAAARALRARPTAAAVPILLGLLTSHSEAIRVEARITLESTTGEDFGARADLWRAWWRDRGATSDVTRAKPRSPATVDRAFVDLALAKGAAALERDALPLSGGYSKAPWDCGGHPVGTTALVLLALHAAGTDPSDRVFAAALDWLVDQPVPAQTYDAGVLAMSLETIGGKRYRKRIAEAARFLVAAQNAAGFWGYPTDHADHSNTQYAVLGLRHAARAGVPVPATTWRAVRDHFLAAQGTDGGWSFVPQSKSDAASTSMTGAGVSCLLVCLENGDPADPRRAETLAALESGFKALGKVAKLDQDPLHALYSIERAGILEDRPAFGGVPWYAPGAQRILDEQGPDGFWTGAFPKSVESSFAILFLEKATPPIAGSTTKSEPTPPADAPYPAPGSAPGTTPKPGDAENPAPHEDPAKPK